MTMPAPDRAAFEALRNEPVPLRRSLKTAAILTRALTEYGLKPVVVGGTAVSFYTGGVYESLDLDLIVPGIKEAAEALADLGFVRQGSATFGHPRVPIVVDLPPEPLEGSPDLLRTVDVDGVPVGVIGVEDVLLERIYLAEKEGDQKAADAARAMALAEWEDIDWTYLAEQAAAPEWRISKALERLKDEVRGLR